jgi:hypothetical protein
VPQRARRRSGLFTVDVIDRETRSFFPETPRDRASDAPPSARDQRDLSVELSHVGLLRPIATITLPRTRAEGSQVRHPVAE